jgi:hypothetical protein
MIVKDTLRDRTKYIYLELGRDLQNNEIYQMSIYKIS